MQTDAPMSRGRETGQNGPPKVRKKNGAEPRFKFLYSSIQLAVVLAFF